LEIHAEADRQILTRKKSLNHVTTMWCGGGKPRGGVPDSALAATPRATNVPFCPLFQVAVAQRLEQQRHPAETGQMLGVGKFFPVRPVGMTGPPPALRLDRAFGLEIDLFELLEL
jgi:hypothetical protein